MTVEKHTQDKNRGEVMNAKRLIGTAAVATVAAMLVYVPLLPGSEVDSGLLGPSDLTFVTNDGYSLVI